MQVQNPFTEYDALNGYANDPMIKNKITPEQLDNHITDLVRQTNNWATSKQFNNIITSKPEQLDYFTDALAKRVKYQKQQALATLLDIPTYETNDYLEDPTEKLRGVNMQFMLNDDAKWEITMGQLPHYYGEAFVTDDQLENFVKIHNRLKDEYNFVADLIMNPDKARFLTKKQAKTFTKILSSTEYKKPAKLNHFTDGEIVTLNSGKEAWYASVIYDDIKDAYNHWQIVYGVPGLIQQLVHNLNKDNRNKHSKEFNEIIGQWQDLWVVKGEDY